MLFQHAHGVLDCIKQNKNLKTKFLTVGTDVSHWHSRGRLSTWLPGLCDYDYLIGHRVIN